MTRYGIDPPTLLRLARSDRARHESHQFQADALVTIDSNLAAKASGVVPLAPHDELFAE